MSALIIPVLFFQSVENALATLVSVAPEKILPKLVGHLCNQLTLPEFFNVSQQDFGIFQCSEGELYDKSVMEKSVSFDYSRIWKISILRPFICKMAYDHVVLKCQFSFNH